MDISGTRVDNEYPTLDADDSQNAGTTGDNFVFDVTVSDNIDVDGVWVNWTHGFFCGNQSMNDDGDGTWSLTITLDHDLEDLVYSLSFNDTSNNWVRNAIENVPVTDNDMPLVDSDDSAVMGYTGDEYLFIIQASDNIAVYEVWVNWTHGYLKENLSLDFCGNAWFGSIILDLQSTDDLYYYIYVNDTFNNYATMINTIAVTDNDEPFFEDEYNTIGTPTTGDPFTFNVNVSDNIDIDTVIFNYSFDNTVWQDVPMALVGTKYQAIITIASDATTIMYRYHIMDGSDNWYNHTQLQKSVEDNDPPVFLGDATVDEPVAGQPFTVSAMISDNIDRRGLTAHVNYSISGGEWALYLLTHTTGVYYNRTIDIPDDAIWFLYYYIAEDASGNLLDTYADKNMTPPVDNIPPIAQAGYNTTINQHENMTFDGRKSWDNWYVIYFTWTFIYDGVEQTLYGELANFTFDLAGTYLVRLNVTDSLGNWGTAHITVTVLDITAPVADLGSDQIVDEDKLVHLNAAYSTDDVGIVNYTWVIEDAEYYGMAINHTFAEPGIYNLSLMVEDAAGNRGTVIVSITVRDKTNPVAKACADIETNEGTTIHFNGGDSTDNVGIVNYTWTFKYANRDTTLYGITPSFKFDIVGAYLVTLTLSDMAGNTATDTETVIIRDATAPIVNATVDGRYIDDGATIEFCDVDLTAGLKVEFDAKDSIDNIGIVNWSWTIKKGYQTVTTMNYEAFEYTFIKGGTYSVLFTVTDAAGKETSMSFVIKVEEKEPIHYDERTIDEVISPEAAVVIVVVFIAVVVLVILLLVFVVFKEKSEQEVYDIAEKEEDGKYSYTIPGAEEASSESMGWKTREDERDR